MPEELRTYPEITPGCSLAQTGSDNPISNAQKPSLRSLTPTPRLPARPLLYSKHRRGINGLLGNVIAYFDFYLVRARLQVAGCDRLLQRDLIADVAHRFGGLHLLHHGFVRGQVHNVEFER